MEKKVFWRIFWFFWIFFWNFEFFVDFLQFLRGRVEQVEHKSDMVGHQALIIWRHNRTIEWCWLDDEWICGKMHGWGRDEKFENAWVWKWMGLTREARYRVRCSWNDSRTNQYENVAQTLWLIHYESCWVKILFSIWLYMSFWIYSAFGLHSFFLRLKMAKLTNQKPSNYHKGHCDKEVARHMWLLKL